MCVCVGRACAGLRRTHLEASSARCVRGVCPSGWLCAEGDPLVRKEGGGLHKVNYFFRAVVRRRPRHMTLRLPYLAGVVEDAQAEEEGGVRCHSASLHLIPCANTVD